MVEEMTKEEFKTVMEMVIKIIEKSETKEEAVENLKELTIFKN